MKIDKIVIDRFGEFQSRIFDFGGRDIVLYCEPNEVGKSTLHSLIRTLLFGFPTTSGKKTKATSPAEFSEGSGELYFRFEKDPVQGVLKRTSMKKGGSSKEFSFSGELFGPDLVSTPLDESDFLAKLGGITREIYSLIFGFSHRELILGAENLLQEEFSKVVYGLGTGSYSNYNAIIMEFEKELNSLFMDNSNASKASINSLLLKLKNQNEELDKIRNTSFNQWDTCRKDITELDRTLDFEKEILLKKKQKCSELKDQLKELQNKRKQLIQRNEDKKRRQDLLDQKSILLDNCNFKPEIIERFSTQTLTSIQGEKNKLDTLVSQIEGLRLKTQRLRSEQKPFPKGDELAEKSEKANSLKNELALLKRWENRLEPFQSLLRSEKEKGEIPNREDLMRLREQRDLLWERLRKIYRKEIVEASPERLEIEFETALKQTDKMADDQYLHADRLAAIENAKEEVQKYKSSYDVFLKEIRILFLEIGQELKDDEDPEEKLTALLHSIDKYQKELKTYNEIQKQLQDTSQEFCRLDEQQKEQQKTLNAILVQNEILSLEQYEKLGDVANKYSTIKITLEAIDQILARTTGVETGVPNDPEEENNLQIVISNLDQELQALQKEYDEKLEERGKLRQKLSTLEEQPSIRNSSAKREKLVCELQVEIDQYIPKLFARQLLQQTQKDFETKFEPTILKDAASIFTRITQGRYINIEKHKTSFLAIKNDQSYKSPRELSTGTREQLYLALRLAHLRHYAQRSEPLPLILDDIFVNWDHERTKVGARVLREVLKENQMQLIFLTCHEEQSALFEEEFETSRLHMTTK